MPEWLKGQGCDPSTAKLLFVSSTATADRSYSMLKRGKYSVIGSGLDCKSSASAQTVRPQRRTAVIPH